MPSDPRSGLTKSLRKLRSLRSIKQKHESAASFNPQPNCRLLQLPAELRNSIYECALASDLDPEERIDLHTLRLPPLAYTCRQMLFETPWVYFSCNRFTLPLRETEHARIPKLLEPVASGTMAILKRHGVENIPIKDARIEKQQPICGRLRKSTTIHLTSFQTSPPCIISTDNVWTSWRPKLESWKLRDEERGPTVEEVIAVGQYMHRACRRVWLNPAVFLYVNLVYRDVRKLNKWRAEGSVPSKMPVKAYDHLQKIKARMDRRS
ncbi:hypothetical protein DOTSEDRAFT_54579 [Dothistroma septosporum NZE10]|uniref:F-box domain-containing protein n=1 Tax=Dothistroma septosporum (strain NZE10 / CBS 128990) TaxID=675120 RepID=N1PHQ5_DOTSN|nr:hypothetical protein DOTSEDRAFT_54579 [Dothistroma septosporum NZE10]